MGGAGVRATVGRRPGLRPQGADGPVDGDAADEQGDVLVDAEGAHQGGHAGDQRVAGAPLGGVGGVEARLLGGRLRVPGPLVPGAPGVSGRALRLLAVLGVLGLLAGGGLGGARLPRLVRGIRRRRREGVALAGVVAAAHRVSHSFSVDGRAARLQ